MSPDPEPTTEHPEKFTPTPSQARYALDVIRSEISRRRAANDTPPQRPRTTSLD